MDVFLFLTTESVEGASLAFESIHNVHSGDGLATSVLGIGDRITNDVFEKDLEDTPSLFVYQSRDTLDTTSTRETADGGLGDALDVVAKDLAVTLGASLSKSLASLSTSRHDCELVLVVKMSR